MRKDITPAIKTHRAHGNLLQFKPIAYRFNYFVNKNHSRYRSCWVWEGTRSQSGTGYGQITYRGNKHFAAHRLAWLLYRGTIPSLLRVLHKCDHRWCVNPQHLFLGTQSDNIQDAIRKGRLYIPQHPHHKHCLDGHKYDRINLEGHQRCSICDNKKRNLRYALKKCWATDA